MAKVAGNPEPTSRRHKRLPSSGEGGPDGLHPAVKSTAGGCLGEEKMLAELPPIAALWVCFPNESKIASTREKFNMKRIIAVAALTTLFSWEAYASPPSAAVAKKCLHFSYIAYPFKRPGKVQASGDRQTYFKACLEKDGDVPEPVKPKP
jgi:hypothetical protein